MTIDVRPCEDLEQYMDAVGAISSYFALEQNPERAERFSQNLPFERMHAAWDDGAIVGGAGAFDFRLSVPGGEVPCAGVTVVGVLPMHRRRGVLRAMMRVQLDVAHERGDPIAALWASEETIYGRFGYGISGWAGEIHLPREYAAYARLFEPRGRVRFVTEEEILGLAPPVWEEVRAERPGMFARSPAWWELRVFRDREGEQKKMYVVLEHEGDVTGYAIYRRHPGWSEGSSTARLEVVEALGRDAVSTATVWRYLLDMDWTATIEASLLPPDHPLFLLLATPRRTKYRMGDSIWTRLVDVGAALSARTYAPGEPLVLDVRDAFCPWNEGRWQLSEDGAAERTEDEPDLALDVDALGSAYLGGVRFAALQRAFRVEELTAGAVERADARFASPLHPWCPEIF
jgi:predicted acetyltransferase